MIAPSAWAGEPRVLLSSPADATPLLEEALIRIRGELGAVGLRIEIRSELTTSPDDLLPLLAEDEYGVILLSQEGSRIDIRAFAKGLETPVSQSAHTNYPGTDAEVVAIRAVEALRAAMIQFARNRSPSADSLPPPVSDFTRLGLPPASSEPESAPVPPSPVPPEPTPPRGPSSWSASLGPYGALELPARTGLFGIQGALFWHPSWLRLGLVGSQTFGGGEMHEPEGAAFLRRGSVQLSVGATHALSSEGFVFVLAGAGIAQHTAEVEAARGFLGTTSTHRSFLSSVHWGAGYWLSEHIGVTGAIGAEFLARAPRFRFDGRDVAATGRPTMTLACGVSFRL